jgi:hypothetical protein
LAARPRAVVAPDAFFARVREDEVPAPPARDDRLRGRAAGSAASVGASPAADALVPVTASAAGAAVGTGLSVVPVALVPVVASAVGGGPSVVLVLVPVPVVASAAGAAVGVGLSVTPVVPVPVVASAVGVGLSVAAVALVPVVASAVGPAVLVAAPSVVASPSVAPRPTVRFDDGVPDAAVRLTPMRSGRVAGRAARTLLSSFLGLELFFFCLSGFSAIGCECTVVAGHRCTPTERRVE